MSAQEYYIGIISIFFAYTLSKYMEGIINFWIKKKAIKFLFVHLIIVALWILAIFQYMWSFFPLMNEYINLKLPNFLIFISPIFIWQVSYFYLFPNVKKNTDSTVFPLDEYFQTHRTPIYLLICSYIAIIQVQVRIFNDPIESDALLAVRMTILLILLLGIVIRKNQFDIAISLIISLGLLFFFNKDSSPNTTKIKIQIDSNSSQKREFLWRNTFVQIGNDTLTNYPVDPRNGEVIISDKSFQIGDTVKVKVVNKLDAPYKFTIIQNQDIFKISFNRKIHVNVELNQ